MKVDWKWLIIGAVVGYVVVPRLQVAVASRKS